METHDVEDTVPVPRRVVRFPIELRLPPGFRPEAPGTWPKIPGRLEYVGGRLLYMSPCGDVQQIVSVALVTLIGNWLEQHPEFDAGGNEAGMMLGEDVRGADAAIWRVDPSERHTGGFKRKAPILAAEIAGQDEDEADLRKKARWYFEHGVQIVWNILPDTREVAVLRPSGEQRYGETDLVPAPPEIPGLELPVARLFRRLRR